MVMAGFAVLIVMLFGWFGTVIRESEARLYNKKVDASFRWSMSWFIFSEVMFFAAFFGALFYVRNISVPDLGSLGQRLLWPDFTAAWPTDGPYIDQKFTPMGAIGIPLLNTILLLSSGVTLTIAHHALKVGKRGGLKLWLFLTIVLGLTFIGFQAYEYYHAYHALNLKLTTGVYGSTFFMLTGFHGAHVTIGAIMLTVMLARAFRGHFTPDHHFAFEAAAWYWHFVDVVWLLLFVLVYWL
jgi:cytochrome c oxidase subunit 3